jgi:AmpD protein
VSCNDRAWHAGASSFEGRERCNDFSIGVEMEGTDFEPFAAAQYETLVALTLALIARYGVADVVGHQHIAPGRKTDPGPCFDWKKFQQALYREVTSSHMPVCKNSGLPRFPFLA